MATKLSEKGKTKKSLWSSIKEQLTINRHLLPIKAVILFFYGGASAFLPYITLHMIQIGLTIEEVGVIYAVLPFAACFGPPIAGMIADKFGNYKLVLIVSVVAMAGLHTSLLLIDANGYDPADRSFNQSIPEIVLSCDGNGGMAVTLVNSCNKTCNPEDLTQVKTVEIIASNCTRSCQNGTVLSGNDVYLFQNETFCDVSPRSLHLNLNDTTVNQEDPFSCSLTVQKLFRSDACGSFDLTCNEFCQTSCPILSTEPAFPTCKPEYDHSKHQRGFWLYLFIRILATAALGTSWTMLDSSTICLIRKYGGELGKQRLLGVIGSAVFAMASGFLLDWTASLNNGEKDYAISFYVADIPFLASLLLLCFMEVIGDKMDGNFLANCFKLIKMLRVNIFMLMMLLLGIFWGYLESFLFVFLLELNAPNYLLGLTVMVGSLVGIPFLFVSDVIVEKVGRLVVLISAFFVYSIRFVGYSFIDDPWMSLPFEALEAVTIHLMAVACSIYCAAAAPTGLLATLQGLAGSCHYSLGRGTGSFIGGILIANYGSRAAFQIMGTSASVLGVVYIVLYFIVFRKYERKPLKNLTEYTADCSAASQPLQQD